MPDTSKVSSKGRLYPLEKHSQGREYNCYECGTWMIPYMVLRVSTRKFVAFCSEQCAVANHVHRDFERKPPKMIFQDSPKESLPFNPREKREKRMDLARDVYLKDKILESGVDLNGVVVPSFSSWDGFGFLLRWAYSQDWWEEFAKVEHPFGIDEAGSSVPIAWIDPDVFAGELYDFL